VTRSSSGPRAVQQQPGHGGRDQFGPGNKFIAPTVAGGKVFIGTTNTLAIFGLLK
jgi:hypothetical protein